MKICPPHVCSILILMFPLISMTTEESIKPTPSGACHIYIAQNCTPKKPFPRPVRKSFREPDLPADASSSALISAEGLTMSSIIEERELISITTNRQEESTTPDLDSPVLFESIVLLIPVTAISVCLACILIVFFSSIVIVYCHQNINKKSRDFKYKLLNSTSTETMKSTSQIPSNEDYDDMSSLQEQLIEGGTADTEEEPIYDSIKDSSVTTGNNSATSTQMDMYTNSSYGKPQHIMKQSAFSTSVESTIYD